MLDFKDNNILKLLIASDLVLTINDVKNSLGMSQRSIYYSLERINQYLLSLGLPAIINKRSVGLIIDKKVIEYFDESKDSIRELYICTIKERNNLQLLNIMLSNEFVNIPLLMDMFDVSRSTIIKDLREIRLLLFRHDLTLDFSIDKGYEIKGEEIQKRSLILIIISEYQYLIKLKLLKLYREDDVALFTSLFVKIEELLGVLYVRTTLSHLMVLLALIKHNNLPKIRLNRDDEKHLLATNEYEIVKSVFQGQINADEYLYIVLHLFGLRIQYNDAMKLTDEDQYLSEIVHFIIHEFYNLTLINFTHQSELYNNLYVHLKQALFRFKFGIIYKNELRNQIMNEFSLVYRITRQICNKLEKIINYKIGEDEVAFIAIYFGGLMEKEHHFIAHPKVLLVCLNGMALYRNLRHEIESFTKDIEIIGAVRECDIDSQKNKVDYIISTIPLKNMQTRAKTLIVNPILNDKERIRIIEFLGLANISILKNDEVENIMDEIKEYIVDNKHDQVKNILTQHINQR